MHGLGTILGPLFNALEEVERLYSAFDDCNLLRKTAKMGICTGILVSTNHYLEYRFKLSKTNNPRLEKKRHVDFGEIIAGSTLWIEGVKTGSNYVRHWEEWNLCYRTSGLSPEDYMKKSICDSNFKGRESASTLSDIGVTPEDLFVNFSPEIVTTLLKLDNIDETARYFESWTDSLQTEGCS